MTKKPDLSDLAKKIDIGGIVNSIKSMINPSGSTPNADPSDALGIKIAEASLLLQKMTEAHKQTASDLGQVNKLLNDIFADLEVLRHQSQNKTTAESDVAHQSQKEEK